MTVVIGSNAPPESLAACLEALEPQRDGVEVLVQEGRPSPADLRDRFPWADFALAPDQLVPEHWRDGIDRASGEIVALTIAPMIPAPDWIATIRRLHADHEVVGGAIEPGPRPPARRLGRVLLPVFARHAALRGDRQRRAGRRQRRPTSDRCWRASRRRIATGSGSRSAPAAGRRRRHALARRPRSWYARAARPASRAFARQRLAHGRRYGHQRGVHFSRSRNLVGVVAAPLVPVLMTLRVLRQVFGKGRYRGRARDSRSRSSSPSTSSGRTPRRSGTPTCSAGDELPTLSVVVASVNGLPVPGGLSRGPGGTCARRRSRRCRLDGRADARAWCASASHGRPCSPSTSRWPCRSCARRASSPPPRRTSP